ncbi:hypothetical protein GCM10022250_35800 [Flavobacterium chungbukense]|uniref:Transposase n=1 Tax=Flavobacterium chungbukense TaxID=877464 RepID=A0ABP7YKQ3_9FLAO
MMSKVLYYKPQLYHVSIEKFIKGDPYIKLSIFVELLAEISPTSK